MPKLNKQDAKLLHDVRWSWAEANNNPKLQAFKEALVNAYKRSLWGEICDMSSSELRESLYDAYTGGCGKATYKEAVEWLVETVNNADADDVAEQGGFVKYGLWLITDCYKD